MQVNFAGRANAMLQLWATITFLGIDLPDHFPGGVVQAIVFGLIGLGILVLGFKVFDWLTPALDLKKELGEKHNVALAIVIGAFLLGVAYIVAHVVGA
jgi:putative membrane protein